jgi:hypothetical protein
LILEIIQKSNLSSSSAYDLLIGLFGPNPT